MIAVCLHATSNRVHGRRNGELANAACGIGISVLSARYAQPRSVTQLSGLFNEIPVYGSLARPDQYVLMHRLIHHASTIARTSEDI
jgi:hypothetical protein